VVDLVRLEMGPCVLGGTGRLPPYPKATKGLLLLQFAKSKCAGRLYSPRISTSLKIIPLCSQSGSNELEMQLETNRSSSSFYAKALKCGIIAPSILPGNNNGEQK